MQQTAKINPINWLKNRLYSPSNSMELLSAAYVIEQFEQANEMFKQQIQAAWKRGGEHEVADELSKKYYTETYKSELQQTERKRTAVEWLADKLDELIPFVNEKTAIAFNKLVEQAKEKEKYQNTITENTSDGYHTFKELYEFRKVYNAALFNEWAKQEIRNPKWKSEDNQPVNLPKYDVHKSWKHYDGELCFGGGWFIVVAMLPTGQISNHYNAEDWELFKIPIVEKAKYAFDGHDSKIVIHRINNTAL